MKDNWVAKFLAPTADAHVSSALFNPVGSCKYWMKAALKVKVCSYSLVVAQILYGNAADLMSAELWRTERMLKRCGQLIFCGGVTLSPPDRSSFLGRQTSTAHIFLIQSRLRAFDMEHRISVNIHRLPVTFHCSTPLTAVTPHLKQKLNRDFERRTKYLESWLFDSWRLIAASTKTSYSEFWEASETHFSFAW